MKRSGISQCMFSCGKAMVKVRLCTFLPSACQVVRGVVRQRIQGNALFLFFITREGRGVGGQGARWSPIGLSYPFLDDVCGALPSAAEHTALKEAFFNPRESHPLAWTLLSSKFPQPPAPSPHPGCRTPAPSCPASPGRPPSASCGSTGAGWRWTPAPVLRRHLFSSGTRVCWCWQGGAELVEGFSLWGWVGGGGNYPRGEKEIKELEHFHTPSLFVNKRLLAPVKR